MYHVCIYIYITHFQPTHACITHNIYLVSLMFVGCLLVERPCPAPCAVHLHIVGEESLMRC